MNSFLRNADFWSGLALAALGAWIVSQAWGWNYMGEDGPGAGFFPRWYGSVMVVLSLFLVAGTVLKKPPAGAREAIRWRSLGRALSCWVAFVVAIALMPFAGFAISFALLTWFIVAVMARRPQRIAMALAIGGAVGFHLIFVWALDLSLPKGLLF